MSHPMTLTLGGPSACCIPGFVVIIIIIVIGISTNIFARPGFSLSHLVGVYFSYPTGLAGR